MCFVLSCRSYGHWPSSPWHTRDGSALCAHEIFLGFACQMVVDLMFEQHRLRSSAFALQGKWRCFTREKKASAKQFSTCLLLGNGWQDGYVLFIGGSLAMVTHRSNLMSTVSSVSAWLGIRPHLGLLGLVSLMIHMVVGALVGGGKEPASSYCSSLSWSW